MMTVRELIAALQTQDPDASVVLSNNEGDSPWSEVYWAGLTSVTGTIEDLYASAAERGSKVVRLDHDGYHA